MKRNLIDFSERRGAYASPSCRISFLLQKSVLCDSNLAGTSPAEEEDYDFDWE